MKSDKKESAKKLSKTEAKKKKGGLEWYCPVAGGQCILKK